MNGGKFINLSSHPSAEWSEEQKEAAGGDIIDIPFPYVHEDAEPNYIARLADAYVEKVMDCAPNDAVVLVMGEMTLSFAIIQRLMMLGYTCVASTTAKSTETSVDNTKRIKFRQFREYRWI